MSTDAEMAAARAACIPDVPKILAAADRLAAAVACGVGVRAALDEYRKLRGAPNPHKDDPK